VAVSPLLHELRWRAFSARARQREHAPAGASTCRHSERATRMNLYSQDATGNVHKNLRTTRSIIAVTERGSQAFPITLTHYVRKQKFSQASTCLNTFFWKYIK